jgi:RNA polymerase sigma factor (sigma-70 family)
MQELNVDKIKSGDSEQLKKLFEVLLPRLRYMVLSSRHRGAHLDVDDLVQEAYFHIFSNIRKYDSKRGDFLAWCQAVTRNVIVDRARRELVERRVKIPIDIDEVDVEKYRESKREQENVDLRRVLDEAVGTLPPDQRRVLQLRLEGMTVKEIGKELGFSRPAVIRHYRSALKTLESLVVSERKATG